MGTIKTIDFYLCHWFPKLCALFTPSTTPEFAMVDISLDEKFQALKKPRALAAVTTKRAASSAPVGAVTTANRLCHIAVAEGDGIGPEIMAATLRILREAGAKLDIAKINMGQDIYLAGNSSGIDDAAWITLRERRVLLKAPMTTPQGGGYKSLNVTLRKSLGLYANVRPCISYAPFVATHHPRMDLVIIRENEEDLYAGIEHRQSDDVFQCLKLITRQGCQRIMRYAFEYARAHGRKKVTCMTKDNIMKMTDGLFHRVFREVGAGYPEIVQEHLIVDIGMARVVDTPEKFDVIVTPNLYGDILSDITAQMTGSIGLAGSANIGSHGAMFEAIHGSAPDIAGQNVANPSGLINAAIMMMHHLGEPDIAARMQNAWLKTIEDGLHTNDIVGPQTKQVLGCKEFAEAVIARLNLQPATLRGADAKATPLNLPQVTLIPRPQKKEMVGVDVFLQWRMHRHADAPQSNHQSTPQVLAAVLQALNTPQLQLTLITSRGVKVWPRGIPETSLTDHWRCRFMAADGGNIKHQDIVTLLGRIAVAGLDFIKTENLCTFDDEPGYSLAQGQ
jgi:isocitrate dehydrogenase